ncbi:MAG TPA: hypothetical protein VHW60_17705 [Caulobacteraceae bacterium]|jgi:outer membrane murein-binding lipoprotein Lpp|nr:hypothetical protein [Caulobacteraceae bacterium]
MDGGANGFVAPAIADRSRVDLRLLGSLVDRLRERVERIEQRLSDDVADLSAQIASIRQQVDELGATFRARGAKSRQVRAALDALSDRVDAIGFAPNAAGLLAGELNAIRAMIRGELRAHVDQTSRRVST